jgi:ABC-type glycerol-3-phosphate transport system substrate-binding protein
MNVKAYLNGAVTVVATLVSVVWAGRIGEPPNTGKVTHVTYWEKWTDFERDAMGAVVDKYNATRGKEMGIHVDFLFAGDIADKTLLAASGGIPPDVAGLSTISLAAFADNRAVMPLDDYCRKYNIKESDYVPVYWRQMYYAGHVYALASTPDSTALHYNRKSFSAAGLNPDRPPQTLEDLDRMSEVLTQKDKKGNYTHFGFLPSDPGWWNWGWGYIFGGKLWDGEGRITCNSPDNVKAFQWIASYAKKYGVAAIADFTSGFVLASANNTFISGKEAMQLQGVWMYNFISRYNKSLDWAAAPFPHPADRPDLAGVTFADLDDLVIPVGAKHPDAAFDFIAFVQRQENMELLCLGQRKQSPLAKVSDEFYRKHPNPFIRIFADGPKGKNAATPPMMGLVNEYTDDLNEAFDEVNSLKKTPKEALDYVHDRIQKKLDRYRWILGLRRGGKP